MTDRANAELTRLGQEELIAIIEDIDAELERHHELDSDCRDAVLAATEEMTESYFNDQGIEITWAWVDYTYTRDWDFYTLSTHIDYRDSEGKSQKPDVYSEVLYEDGDYNVYYLQIDSQSVLDKRDDLPETNWTSTPESEINEVTGLDLAIMTQPELRQWRQQVEKELSNNHTPDSKTSHLIDSLAENVVDAYFDKQDADVSWPWFDYTYTCDWGFYTYRAPVTIRSEGDEDQESDVYAEAYPLDGQYALTYLSVGEEVLIDRRSEVPEPLYPEAEKESEPVETAVPAEAAEPIGTPVPTSEPTAAPEPTATPVPVHIEIGANGDEVLALQRRLIALGYLSGSADGAFGGQTQGAVQALQNAHGLEANGVVTEKEMAAIQDDMKEYAKRAIAVAMTNCQSADVLASDGNTYDTSKFHNYAYTSGLHAEVREEGDWTQTGTDSWHVEDIQLQLIGADDSYMKLTLDVTFNGENYVLSAVTRTMGKSAYLDSGDLSKLNIEEMEPSESTPYLTVSPALLSDKAAEEGPVTTSEEAPVPEDVPSSYDDQARKDWISGQFSIWSGAHKDLEDIIKRNLNDEKSYKHIETNYVDVYDEAMCDIVNDFLSGAGYSQRVEIGDLFIMTEFSAKNVFNATIKSMAYGIASYQNNTIELIGIE